MYEIQLLTIVVLYDSWAIWIYWKGLEIILYVLILTSSYHGYIITLCCLNTLNHFPRRDKPNSHAARSDREKLQYQLCSLAVLRFNLCLAKVSLQVQVLACQWTKSIKWREWIKRILRRLHRSWCMGSHAHLFRGLLKGDINGRISLNPTQVSFCKARTGEVSFFFRPSLSLSLSLLRVAILCLFLQALQSLPLDCPCHMGLWPHTPLDVFVAERHSQFAEEKYSAHTFSGLHVETADCVAPVLELRDGTLLEQSCRMMEISTLWL